MGLSKAALMIQRCFAPVSPLALPVAALLVAAGAGGLRAAVPPTKKYVALKPINKAIDKTPAHPQPVKKVVPKQPSPQALFASDVLPLVNQFCGSCHVQKSKGGVSLKGFTTAASLHKDLKLWDSVLHNVQSGVMPPEDSPQPTKAQRDKFIAWLTSMLAEAEAKVSDPGRVTIHRLNQAEYNNTIRDLLGIDFQPANDFPADDVGYGFDNIGDVLSISPLLMEKYLNAAEQIADKAIALPPRKRIRYELDDLKGGGMQDSARFLASSGEIFARPDIKKDGQYLLRIGAWAHQAGDELAKLRLKLDDKEVTVLEVKGTPESPELLETKITTKAGKHKIAVEFINDFYNETLPEGKRDRNVAVEFMDVIGPMDAVADMPPSHKQIIFREPPVDATPAQQDECAREILTKQARRLWRRPATTAEVDRLMRAFQLVRKENDSFERGIQLGLQAILVSPNFLFRAEIDDEPNNAKLTRNLNDYELATRLSYFLWSSAPDGSLDYYSDKGALRDTKNLGYNARRMLKDDRARAMADNFAGQWLQLRSLDQVSPDPATFPQWNDELRAAMKAETLKFFETVVREDRSILEFLDANYSFLNEPLAKLYGVPDVTGPELRRVEFSGDMARRRGGLLTQASILTLTSNPTRTSPVKRGKWVLEQIFNAPPPPAPPDVPDLPSQEVAPNSTVRQRLEAHRKNPACSSCHARMDGIGFGLENYNGVGAWRDKDGKLPLDTSGTLVDGAKFKGPVQLKTILKSRKDVFVRSLSERMLTYALGRGLERYDRRAVDEIVIQVKKNDYRFSALVTAIVTSEPFRKKRGDDTK